MSPLRWYVSTRSGSFAMIGSQKAALVLFMEEIDAPVEALVN